MVRALDNLVGGTWVGVDDERWLSLTDPSDVRTATTHVPAMRADDVRDVYEAGETGARVWRETGALARGAVLTRTAELLRERGEEIAADVVREVGKTVAEARAEVRRSADFFDYYAGLARTPYGSLLHDARPDTSTSQRVEPLGLVLAITPWNDPLLTPSRKVAPALAAGNAVVLKPALQTPTVAVELARALDDAGIPAGVFNTVTGRDAEISEALLDDSRVAAVSFTGSRETGKWLKRRMADHSARLQTEMGGKNASVVLADAELEPAVRTVAEAAFGQAGQRCTATSRVIVERSVAEQLTERLVAHAEGRRLGPGIQEDTTLGPLVSRAHRDGVHAHVQTAIEEGARLVTGGGAPDKDHLAHGCYYRPTVLADVRRGMAIWRDEVFGPVVVVHAVDGVDEAVAAANDTVYGLAAAIFTTRLDVAYRFCDLVDAGQVAVNRPTTGWDVHHPFGGFRDSGSPFKEQGHEGLGFYTRVKTCAIGYRSQA